MPSHDSIQAEAEGTAAARSSKGSGIVTNGRRVEMVAKLIVEE
jgi:hypothetical protein